MGSKGSHLMGLFTASLLGLAATYGAVQPDGLIPIEPTDGIHQVASQCTLQASASLDPGMMDWVNTTVDEWFSGDSAAPEPTNQLCTVWSHCTLVFLAGSELRQLEVSIADLCTELASQEVAGLLGTHELAFGAMNDELILLASPLGDSAHGVVLLSRSGSSWRVLRTISSDPQDLLYNWQTPLFINPDNVVAARQVVDLDNNTSHTELLRIPLGEGDVAVIAVSAVPFAWQGSFAYGVADGYVEKIDLGSGAVERLAGCPDFRLGACPSEFTISVGASFQDGTFRFIRSIDDGLLELIECTPSGLDTQTIAIPGERFGEVTRIWTAADGTFILGSRGQKFRIGATGTLELHTGHLPAPTLYGVAINCVATP